MKKSLFINGAEVLRAEKDAYYKCVWENDWDFMAECSRDEFIEELKKFSWVCLTSWSGDLRKEYLDLVDYVKEVK